MDELVKIGAGEGIDTADPGSGGAPGQARISSNGAPRQVSIRDQEYQRAIATMEATWDRMLRGAAIGFSVATALVVLIAGGQLSEPSNPWTYGIAPLVLTLLYVIAMQMISHIAFATLYARDLEDEIANRIDIPYVHDASAVARGRWRYRPARLPLVAGFSLAAIVATALYLLSIGWCLVQLQQFTLPPWQLATFVIVQGFLAVSLVWTGLSWLGPLRDEVETWPARSDEDAAPAIAERNRAGLLWHSVAYALLPRPVDLLLKGIGTILALALAAYCLGIGPSWDLFWAGFWVIVCVDFFAKQATYIWNDVLDLHTDKTHSLRAKTRLLARFRNATVGKALFVIRAITAFALAFALQVSSGLWWLPPLVAVIFAWQFAYDRWAKRGPLRRLIFASVGSAERAIAGVLVVMTVAGRFDGLVLLLVTGLIIAYSATVLAEYWWAEYTKKWSEKFPPGTSMAVARRYGSAAPVWFIDRGQRYQHIANAVLLVIGLTCAFFFSGDRAERVEPILSRLQRGLETLTPARASLDRAVANVARSISQLQLAIPDTAGATGILALVLGVVGIPAIFSLAKRVHGKNRQHWLLGLLAAALLVVLFVPSSLKLVMLAFIGALVTGVVYEKLSFDDITRLEKLLHRHLPLLPQYVDHVLFGPWAVRISIVPVSDDHHAPGSDCATVVGDLFNQWRMKNSLACCGSPHTNSNPCQQSAPEVSQCPSVDDGNGPNDMVVCGRVPDLRSLLDESGYHECSYVDGSDYAFVSIMPMPVPTQPSVGAGLNVPIPAAMTADDKMSVVRKYVFDDSAGLVGFNQHKTFRENGKNGAETVSMSRYLKLLLVRSQSSPREQRTSPNGNTKCGQVTGREYRKQERGA